MSSSLFDDDKAPPAPPAPPLPSPPSRTKSSQAKGALARIAARASDNPSPPRSPIADGHDSAQPGLSSEDISNSFARYRNVIYRTGIPIVSLDASPARTHAVLAGRDILRIVRLTDHPTSTSCTETLNLRAALTAHTGTHKTANGHVSARQRDQLAANDVKWSHGSFDKKIAIAAANGQIVIYDVDRVGLEWARLHEHNRQVHRLAFNPHGGYLMLSGSQDASIRMWDLRDFNAERSAMSMNSRKRFSGNSDAVRDIRWSPTNAMEFAAATDSGLIQRWDIRKETAPLLKISAHEKACQAVDWHPDGKHIVSAGLDKNVKVWDFSSSDRRMKPIWQLRAPQAVMHARWRPACWHTGDNRPGNWQCTELATSFDQEDPRILIWDFRRPSVPSYIFDRYEDPPSELLWHSEDFLWSVGAHGIFTQTNIASLPKTSRKLRSNTLAWAPDGSLFVASVPPQRGRSSLDELQGGSMQQRPRRDSAVSRSNSAEVGSLDDSSPLSSSLKSRRSTRRSSPRALPRVSTSTDATPPTPGSGAPIVPLDKSLRDKGIYNSGQILGILRVPGVSDITAFKFLAAHYKSPLPLPGEKDQAALGNHLHLSFTTTFYHNARVAAEAGQYRMASTWEIMAFAAEKELKKRAEDNYQQRQHKVAAKSVNDHAISHTLNSDISDVGQNPSALSPDSDGNGPLSDITMQSVSERFSDMATPLAKPLPDNLPYTANSLAVSEISLADQLQLPDPSFPKQIPKSFTDVSGLDLLPNPHGKKDAVQVKDISSTSSEGRGAPHTSNIAALRAQLPGLELRTAEQIAAAQNYRGIPRPILTYGNSVQMRGQDSNGPNFFREDSDESFHIFPSSNESSRRMGFESNDELGSLSSMHGSTGDSSSPASHMAFMQRSHDSEPHDLKMAFRTDDEGDFGYQVDPTFKRLEDSKSLEVVHSHIPPIHEGASSQSALTASFRPLNNPPPIVHYEDMECLNEGHLLEQPLEPEGREFTLSDLELPQRSEPRLSLVPWSLTAMLDPLIKYHIEALHDLQFPTYCWLHLSNFFQSYDTMYSIHDVRLNLMNQYYDKLMTHGLYIEACEVRKHAENNYPELVERVCHGMETGGPWCTNCNKSNKGTKQRYCDRCNKSWAPCPICQTASASAIIQPRTASVDGVASRTVVHHEASDRLWTWCQRCGHGGHVGCMTEFWKDAVASEGSCPVPGCQCDCIPGIRRDEINKQLAEEYDKKIGPVKPDHWVAGESAAVKGARRLAGGRGLLQGGAGRGDAAARPQTLLASGRSASGGKKVRIVEPTDADDNDDGGKGILDGGAEGSNTHERSTA